jgi:hypothetical protein
LAKLFYFAAFAPVLDCTLRINAQRWRALFAMQFDTFRKVQSLPLTIVYSAMRRCHYRYSFLLLTTQHAFSVCIVVSCGPPTCVCKSIANKHRLLKDSTVCTTALYKSYSLTRSISSLSRNWGGYCPVPNYFGATHRITTCMHVMHRADQAKWNYVITRVNLSPSRFWNYMC